MKESSYEFVQRWWKAHEDKIAHSEILPGSITDMRFLTLALCGEAGELANVFKKQWRDNTEFRENLEAAKAELADVLMYANGLAHALGLDPFEIQLEIFAKVQERWRLQKESKNDSSKSG